jgi:GH18 family chitinase/LysM repeat protein
MFTVFKSLALGFLLCSPALAAHHHRLANHNSHFLSRRATNITTFTACGKDAAPGNEKCPLNVCCSEFGNCGTTIDFCGTGCQNGCDQPAASTCSTNDSATHRTVGYYESWASARKCQSVLPKDLNVTGFTHINYAFLLFDPTTFAIAPANESDIPLITEFTDLKTSNPGLKTWVSVGGWSFNDPGATVTAFSDMVSCAENRTKFIHEIKSFMQTYAFDGLDIDWEYPSALDRGGAPADRANLVLLTKELRAAFGTQYGLSVTLPAGYYYLQNFDVNSMQSHVDFFNVMAYDLHGVWDNSTTGPGPYIRPHTNLTEIDGALDLLWRAEVTPEKVNMGLAWYGRTFTLEQNNCTTPNGVCQFSDAGLPGPCSDAGGTLNLQEIQDIIAQENLTPGFDETAAIKYLSYNKTQWVGYDDDQTIRLKQAFASKRCLGGTMVWAMDQADQKSAYGLPEAVRPEGPNSSAPPTEYGNGTAAADCTQMQASGNTTCASIIALPSSNFTPAQLKAWNPQIASWDPVTPGQSICVSPPGGWYVLAPPPPLAATAAGTNASATASASGPSKTQAGIAADCNFYATAAAGDTCIRFAAAHGIETAQLYAWNPVLGENGSACATSFWAEENYCIGVSSSANTSTTADSSAGSPTATSNAPMETQAGIAADCTSFATAVAGDTCIAFAAAHGIETAQLYAWNPVLGTNGSACAKSFWAEESYCIGTASSSGSVSSGTGA